MICVGANVGYANFRNVSAAPHMQIVFAKMLHLQNIKHFIQKYRNGMRNCLL